MVKTCCAAQMLLWLLSHLKSSLIQFGHSKMTPLTEFTITKPGQKGTIKEHFLWKKREGKIELVPNRKIKNMNSDDGMKSHFSAVMKYWRGFK